MSRPTGLPCSLMRELVTVIDVHERERELWPPHAWLSAAQVCGVLLGLYAIFFDRLTNVGLSVAAVGLLSSDASWARRGRDSASRLPPGCRFDGGDCPGRCWQRASRRGVDHPGAHGPGRGADCHGDGNGQGSDGDARRRSRRNRTRASHDEAQHRSRPHDDDHRAGPAVTTTVSGKTETVPGPASTVTTMVPGPTTTTMVPGPATTITVAGGDDHRAAPDGDGDRDGDRGLRSSAEAFESSVSSP